MKTRSLQLCLASLSLIAPAGALAQAHGSADKSSGAVSPALGSSPHVSADVAVASKPVHKVKRRRHKTTPASSAPASSAPAG